ncbi:unnamed protein product, partial [Ceratitis capitata]
KFMKLSCNLRSLYTTTVQPPETFHHLPKPASDAGKKLQEDNNATTGLSKFNIRCNINQPAIVNS